MLFPCLWWWREIDCLARSVHLSLCDYISVWTCVYKCACTVHWKQQIEQRFVWAVCVSVPMYDCDLGVHCSQQLMTFACCSYEQSDLAVLIKTNGTDHSLLIVFHWQMAHLSPEDCCRGLACLEHTDCTNENRWSVSVHLCVCEQCRCMSVNEQECVYMCICVHCICAASLPCCALACVKSETLLH